MILISNIEPDHESIPTEIAPTASEDQNPPEPPVVPEAGKCPGGCGFLSSWALDPVHRTSPRNVKLIDIFLVVDESIPEPVVVEDTPGRFYSLEIHSRMTNMLTRDY